MAQHSVSKQLTSWHLLSRKNLAHNCVGGGHARVQGIWITSDISDQAPSPMGGLPTPGGTGEAFKNEEGSERERAAYQAQTVNYGVIYHGIKVSPSSESHVRHTINGNSH